MSTSVVQGILYITYALQALILIRAVLSWLPLGSNPVSALVFHLTEPLLTPIRRILPRTGAFDLSPMVALLLIFLVQALVTSQV